MGFAEFLEKRFLGQMICVEINNGDSETLMFADNWSINREYFRGVVKEIVEGIIVLEILDEGEIYINPDQISYIWPPNVNPYKIMKTVLNKKPNRIGKNI